MKFTEIKISGLKEGTHAFEFSLDNAFLDVFSRNLFDKPELHVQIGLLLTEHMITAQVQVSGSVELTCDRSLDLFREPIRVSATHYFKFGEEEQELSDELDVISKERVSLDFDQLVYDIVALSIPGRHLHPRFREEEEAEGEGTLVYQSEPSDQTNETKPDPRWDLLKNVNFHE